MGAKGEHLINKVCIACKNFTVEWKISQLSKTWILNAIIVI